MIVHAVAELGSLVGMLLGIPAGLHARSALLLARVGPAKEEG